MTSQIHASAIVSHDAELGDDVEIGPLCVVESGVRIGRGTRLLAQCVVLSGTTLGAGNVVHPFAVLGGAPQDRSYAGESTRLSIGDGNVFREHVTANRGTARDRGETRIGDHGLFLAGAHVAHDCVVGDHVTLANATLLGGHVTVGDHVTTGGGVAIQPHVRLGSTVFLAGGARVETDVPPFLIAAGDRARVRALNKVGLTRRGVPAASIDRLEELFRAIFRGDSPRRVAVEALRGRRTSDPFETELLGFFP